MGAACRREAKDEGTAFADLAGLERERAAVPLGQLPADEEAQPGARLRAQARIVDPEKALERSEERRVGKECRSRWSPYH